MNATTLPGVSALSMAESMKQQGVVETLLASGKIKAYESRFCGCKASIYSLHALGRFSMYAG